MSDRDLHILAPNYLGTKYTNRGLDEITKNRGFGVREALAGVSTGVAQKEDSDSSSPAKNKLRIAKAREFGKTKEEVGF